MEINAEILDDILVDNMREQSVVVTTRPLTILHDNKVFY